MTEITVLGKGIVRIKAKAKGPTIGIVCNVHGNELCGRKAVQRVLSEYEIRRGALVLIDGNQEAALLNRRFVGSDMNRMFTKKLLSKENPKQDLLRAQYLAEVIPTLGLDHAIDFHSTSTETRYPFTVSFPGSEQLTELCPVPRIYGWPGRVDGTLVEWMNKNGIPTVVVEAGQHFSNRAVNVAEKTLLSVLSHFGLIELKKPLKTKRQKTFEVVEGAMVGDAGTFKFTRVYGSFDELKSGEKIARDETKTYRAPDMEELQILMPALQKNVTDGTSPGAYYLIKPTEKG
ncbi:MAG: succinylglutamate desuccinylase/aspartoacylase family protein [Pseudomonadota bacterium]